jgi:UDP:flavonoid glycosyltransferase YjiC (YdhE family)
VRTIVFYISGHGFGHASRSIEIINALVDRRPDLRILIRSSVAPWLVTRTARPGVELSPKEVDTGVVQRDSLNLDAGDSIKRAAAFMATFDDRVGAEVEFLRAQAATLTISDVPPLGIAAGRAAGLPAVATGNFTWDWIYAHYEGGESVAQQIGEVYRNTTLALRMPMWGGFETMPDVRDIPFVARRSQRDPNEVREALGIPRDQRVVLTSFGGYGVEGIDTAALDAMDDYLVLLPGMLDEKAMYDRGYRYEDLVRAVDVVATKPGYGIISECLANDTALLYTSRGDFREYPVLVEAMPKFLRCAFINHADLFAGNWQPHLDALLAQPEPPTRRATNGADVAADILLGILDDSANRHA